MGYDNNNNHHLLRTELCKAKSFTYIMSFNPHNKPVRSALLLSSNPKWQNQWHRAYVACYSHPTNKWQHQDSNPGSSYSKAALLAVKPGSLKPDSLNHRLQDHLRSIWKGQTPRFHKRSTHSKSLKVKPRIYISVKLPTQLLAHRSLFVGSVYLLIVRAAWCWFSCTLEFTLFPEDNDGLGCLSEIKQLLRP